MKKNGLFIIGLFIMMNVLPAFAETLTIRGYAIPAKDTLGDAELERYTSKTAALTAAQGSAAMLNGCAITKKDGSYELLITGRIRNVPGSTLRRLGRYFYEAGTSVDAGKKLSDGRVKTLSFTIDYGREPDFGTVEGSKEYYRFMSARILNEIGARLFKLFPGKKKIAFSALYIDRRLGEARAAVSVRYLIGSVS